MAPENIKSRLYGMSSDVWSFGVTLWGISNVNNVDGILEIIAREEPYSHLDSVQVAVEVTREIDPLRLVFPSYTPSVIVEIITQCFVLEPNGRPGKEAYLLF